MLAPSWRRSSDTENRLAFRPPPSCGDYAPTLDLRTEGCESVACLAYVIRTLEAGQTTTDTRRRRYAERKPDGPTGIAGACGRMTHSFEPPRATTTACEGRGFHCAAAAAVADVVALLQQRQFLLGRIFVRGR